MDKIFVVRYSWGQYDYAGDVDIFATTNEQKAIAYTKKFNSILNKWQNYFMEEDQINNDRYYDIMDINSCYYDVVEVR